jgi:hypothetical protein
MSASNVRKLAPSPIARPASPRAIAAERAVATPGYVAAYRALKIALLVAPIGVAAACGTTRYPGSQVPVTPVPSASTEGSAEPDAQPTPSTTPATTPIAPPTVPPPAAGGKRPTMPETI